MRPPEAAPDSGRNKHKQEGSPKISDFKQLSVESDYGTL